MANNWLQANSRLAWLEEGDGQGHPWEEAGNAGDAGEAGGGWQQ